jgi:hypothetical protein
VIVTTSQAAVCHARTTRVSVRGSNTQRQSPWLIDVWPPDVPHVEDVCVETVKNTLCSKYPTPLVTWNEAPRIPSMARDANSAVTEKRMDPFSIFSRRIPTR